MSEKIKVAVLGAGGRSRYVVKNLLRDSENKVEIAALFDPDKEVMKLALAEWGTQNSVVFYIKALNFVLFFSKGSNNANT